MLRELQVTMNKPANAQYKSGETGVLVTGMAVLKNEADGTFELPTEETAADLFFLDKERVPTGINAARSDMSDYDKDFTNIAPDEFAKMIAYYVGERFAIDQYAEGLADGDRLAAGTDGKMKKAGSGIASKYIYRGIHNDNGHELAIIEVSDTPAANA